MFVLVFDGTMEMEETHCCCSLRNSFSDRFRTDVVVANVGVGVEEVRMIGRGNERLRFGSPTFPFGPNITGLLKPSADPTSYFSIGIFWYNKR